MHMLLCHCTFFFAQWGTLLDELFAHVIPYLPGGPRAPRDFPASEDTRTCIQMATAAVLQMIQARGWGLLGAGARAACCSRLLCVRDADAWEAWLHLPDVFPSPLLLPPFTGMRGPAGHGLRPSCAGRLLQGELRAACTLAARAVRRCFEACFPRLLLCGWAGGLAPSAPCWLITPPCPPSPAARGLPPAPTTSGRCALTGEPLGRTSTGSLPRAQHGCRPTPGTFHYPRPPRPPPRRALQAARRPRRQG